MQPYFMPYAGYFRLMAAADVFVIYDCVQFPKGGWVHRNRLPDATGQLRWLTLPVQRCPLHTMIEGLEFMPDAADVMRERLRSFPDLLDRLKDDPLQAHLLSFDTRPVDYLVTQLQEVSSRLDLSTQIVKASSLRLNSDEGAADRVMQIVKQLDGDAYVNAPGGRALYEHRSFLDAGIQLHFLCDYPGSSTSILHRLLHEDPQALRNEIVTATLYGGV